MGPLPPSTARQIAASARWYTVGVIYLDLPRLTRFNSHPINADGYLIDRRGLWALFAWDKCTANSGLPRSGLARQQEATMLLFARSRFCVSSWAVAADLIARATTLAANPADAPSLAEYIAEPPMRRWHGGEITIGDFI
jgi:hypothetical protein